MWRSICGTRHSDAAISVFSALSQREWHSLPLRKWFIYLGSVFNESHNDSARISSPAVSKVFVLTGLDRCGLCRGCEWVWFRALSKWSSVSGVRRTGGVLLHLSSLLQRPLVQPALWPLRPPPQSLPEQLHLPDTLQWNSLLQMPSWWVNTPPQPHTNSASFFFFPFFFFLLFLGHFLSLPTRFCSIGYNA